jgi:16S rRNA (guanine966-N2)-methyltransferase
MVRPLSPPTSTVSVVRVIGGTARGRALKAPSSPTVRPTSERAREAIFDALGAIGAVNGAVVLDLFAGSGALGIEALSRGAAAATFVDHDRHALEVVEKNLAATGLGQPGTDATARLVRRDAVSYLANSGHFDLAFIDPPYDYGPWTKIFRHLNADIAVLESNQAIEPEGDYELYRSYKYGGTLVHIVKRHPDGEATRAS